jgi:glycosyltransferase involved in cell wall biosynthesis
LLGTLLDGLANFPYACQIVISDNASTDNTAEVVGAFLDKLPIKYFKQANNSGVERNYFFALDHADGILLMYLADDDMLDFPALTRAVGLMLSQPDAVALYAPWRVFDMVNNKHHSNFYRQPDDLMVSKNDHVGLVKHVVQNDVWPEISIVRAEMFRRARPTMNPLAYWAFTIPCEYLGYGHVIFLKDPFYISITNYFADDVRLQQGNLEVMGSWDRYRGGWEYMLARARSRLTADDLAVLRAGIDRLVVSRMSVALRMRWHGQKDPVESYFLANRLLGLGAEALLPAPFFDIRSKAAFWFLTHDNLLTNEVDGFCCVGEFDVQILTLLRNLTTLPVILLADFPDDIERSIVLLKGELADHVIDLDRARGRGNKIVAENDLTRKFY